MFFNKPFILASSSQSRFRILKNNKLNFTRMKPICNELHLKKKLIKNKTKTKHISLELARSKSKSISIKKQNNLVVGSDTIIDFEGIILNKAKNLKDAKNKIMKMSGKTHTIYSSASIFLNSKEIWNATQKTIIKIRQISEKDIDNYLFLNRKDILNSVGCYQIEQLGPYIVEEIKGDFFNVMGFPLFPFLKFIKCKRNKND
jgi:septum formation protein